MPHLKITVCPTDVNGCSIEQLLIINILRKSPKQGICYRAVFYNKGLHDRSFPENFLEIFSKAVFQNNFGRLCCVYF